MQELRWGPAPKRHWGCNSELPGLCFIELRAQFYINLLQTQRQQFTPWIWWIDFWWGTSIEKPKHPAGPCCTDPMRSRWGSNWSSAPYNWPVENPNAASLRGNAKQYRNLVETRNDISKKHTELATSLNCPSDTSLKCTRGSRHGRATLKCQKLGQSTRNSNCYIGSRITIFNIIVHNYIYKSVWIWTYTISEYIMYQHIIPHVLLCSIYSNSTLALWSMITW